MASKSYDSVYEMRIRKQRELERGVLRHLRDHRGNPHTFDKLYFMFSADGGADIAPALEDLRHWKYINVERNNTVTITEAGLERLNRHD